MGWAGVVALKLLKNGWILEYILKAELTEFADGLLCHMRTCELCFKREKFVISP